MDRCAKVVLGKGRIEPHEPRSARQVSGGGHRLVLPRALDPLGAPATITLIAYTVGGVLIVASAYEFFNLVVSPGWKWLHGLAGVVFLAAGVMASTISSSTTAWSRPRTGFANGMQECLSD